MTQAVLAIDQGSSSTKALLLDVQGHVVARGTADVATQHPQPGWVQQDANHIWSTVQAAVSGALAQAADVEVAAIGLSTQRESLVVWSRATGEPLAPVLTWQDRRSAVLLPGFVEQASRIRELSGLPLDPMFSALKAALVLADIDASGSDVCIGTIDSWLLWKLGAGHVIEVGNASRTQLLDVATGLWSGELVELFGIPSTCLPEVVASNQMHKAVAGVLPGIAAGVPIAGVLGDSHAALFAHAGWMPGRVKATYGTGSSVMALGPGADAASGLCTTIAWSDERGIAHALEGNILSSGSTLVWLAELFGTTVDSLAERASLTSDAVHLVPAFNGLGAPWWDERATGTLTGLTLGTGLAEIASAGLDSIAMQVADVVDAMRETGVNVDNLRADGGAIRNTDLMQRQADFAGTRISVSSVSELSAVGAANFAGRTLGLWSDADLEARALTEAEYEPALSALQRIDRRHAWHSAVARSRMVG